MNNNYPESVEKIVNDYLSRLKEHLNGLPEKDQAEFIKEIASHIYESYTGEECEDGVERILSVLKKLGEPSTVFSQKIPAKMVHKGKEKNLPLYILSGVLIGLFGIPLGISGIAIVISMIGTIFALLVAYFATAISLVVAGFLGTPPMNFFNGRIQFKNDNTYFATGDEVVLLPARMKNQLAGYDYLFYCMF